MVRNVILLAPFQILCLAPTTQCTGMHVGMHEVSSQSKQPIMPPLLFSGGRGKEGKGGGGSSSWEKMKMDNLVDVHGDEATRLLKAERKKVPALISVAGLVHGDRYSSCCCHMYIMHLYGYQCSTSQPKGTVSFLPVLEFLAHVV